DPLPAELGSDDPQKGSCVLANLASAPRTVLPMSNTRPLLLRWACLAHRVYRSNWSTGSNPCFSIRLSARQRAIEVSSVHSPASRWKGPPPNMSSIFLNDPGDLNSRVVPTASPTASPSIAPLNLDCRFTRDVS